MKVKHIGAFCEPGPSHIKNTAAVGRELMRRGHRFTLFHLPQLESQVKDEGVPFAPLCASAHAPASPRESEIAYPVDDKQEGHSVDHFLSFATRNARLVCDVAPEALRAADVDAVLADMAQPAAATVAEHLRLPYVTLCNALPLHRHASVPPDFLPWTYHIEWWAKCRNAVAYRCRDYLIRPLNRVLNEYRTRWQLHPYQKPEDSFSPLAQITQLVREFDFPHPNLPACFHYVGPYRRAAFEHTPFPFDRLDGRPLVYASLGTSCGDRVDVWTEIANSCAELDVQLVISLGGAPRKPELANLRGSPLVVDYAPQSELLARASAVITHAGLNTVMETLAAGVPMLAVPITGDQFGVAARLAYRGAGKVIHLQDFHAATVKAALSGVLSEPSHRANAQKIRDAIGATRGAETAANIVESVLFNASPVLSI